MTRPGGASVARRFCSVGCTARGAWGTERPTGCRETWRDGRGGGMGGGEREKERERETERAREAEGEGAGENSRRAQQRTRSLQGAAAVRENVCCRRGQPALLGWALDSARSLGPGPARLVISAQSRGAAGCAPFGPGQIQMRWVWWTGGVRAQRNCSLPRRLAPFSPVTCRAAVRVPHRPHPVGRHQHHRPWSRASTRGTA